MPRPREACGEAVEHEALAAVRLGEPCQDEPRDRVARSERSVGDEAEQSHRSRVARGGGFPDQPSGRDVGHAERLGEIAALTRLAGKRGPETRMRMPAGRSGASIRADVTDRP